MNAIEAYMNASFNSQFSGGVAGPDEETVTPGAKVISTEDLSLLRQAVVAEALRRCGTPDHQCHTEEGRRLITSALCDAWNAVPVRTRLGLHAWATLAPGERIPEGWAWNEATVPAGDPWNNVLGSIVAMDIAGRTQLAGTGFIVDSDGDKAIMCTAAHVLLAARDAQHPEHGRQRTMPAPLRAPEPSPLLDRERLRITCVRGESVSTAVVTAAAWDRGRDLAFLWLGPEEPSIHGLFPAKVNVSGRMPDVGEEISLLAYDRLEVSHQVIGGDRREVHLTQRLALRAGRVSLRYLDRGVLCPCPAVETTIPVSDGMSGGAAFFVGADGHPVTAFGFVCAGEHIPRTEILDRSVAGHSTIAMLPAELRADGTTAITLAAAETVVFKER